MQIELSKDKLYFSIGEIADAFGVNASLVRFWDKEFDDISLDELDIDSVVTDILKIRFDEIKKCFSSKAHLSVIFMAGSSLEGILLGVALKNQKAFNVVNHKIF